MRNRTRKNLAAEINVVPYIDVMLVLLVIFMITAPMLTQGVAVELPKVQGEEVISNGKEPVIVSVNKLGEYFLNISSTPESPIAAQDLLVRVAAELRLAENAHEKLPVLVKGDQGVQYGKVVAAMGLLKQAGAKEVGLITDPVKGSD